MYIIQAKKENFISIQKEIVCIQKLNQGIKSHNSLKYFAIKKLKKIIIKSKGILKRENIISCFFIFNYLLFCLF